MNLVLNRNKRVGETFLKILGEKRKREMLAFSHENLQKKTGL